MVRKKRVENWILKLVPQDGSSIGNGALMKKIAERGYEERDYWIARDMLVQEGILTRGHGRGGSVHLAKPSTPHSDTASREAEKQDSNRTGRTEIKPDEREIADKLLRHIPSDGSTVSNKVLLTHLKKEGFSEEQYWAVRNKLINEGRLGKARGQGGSVYLVAAKAAKLEKAKKATVYKKENTLYEPFRKQIEGFWIRDNNLDQNASIIEVTAHQGKRKKPGKWSIPDITVISVRLFTYVPGKTLEVTTFEVKPQNELDVKGVFETASHTRFAHRSYLAVFLPDGPPDSDSFSRLLKECERFGIGFIYFAQPDDWTTYETLVDPVRQSPDPEEVDAYIRNVTTQKGRERLGKLVK